MAPSADDLGLALVNQARIHHHREDEQEPLRPHRIASPPPTPYRRSRRRSLGHRPAGLKNKATTNNGGGSGSGWRAWLARKHLERSVRRVPSSSEAEEEAERHFHFSPSPTPSPLLMWDVNTYLEQRSGSGCRPVNACNHCIECCNPIAICLPANIDYTKHFVHHALPNVRRGIAHAANAHGNRNALVPSCAASTSSASSGSSASSSASAWSPKKRLVPPLLGGTTYRGIDEYHASVSGLRLRRRATFRVTDVQLPDRYTNVSDMDKEHILVLSSCEYELTRARRESKKGGTADASAALLADEFTMVPPVAAITKPEEPGTSMDEETKRRLIAFFTEDVHRSGLGAGPMDVCGEGAGVGVGVGVGANVGATTHAEHPQQQPPAHQPPHQRTVVRALSSSSSGSFASMKESPDCVLDINEGQEPGVASPPPPAGKAKANAKGKVKGRWSWGREDGGQLRGGATQKRKMPFKFLAHIV